MTDLQAWSPLGPDYDSPLQRQIRELQFDWITAPKVSFAPSTGISSSQPIIYEGDAREEDSNSDESDDEIVVPVLPFVRSNGALGLMKAPLSGFGLSEEDLYSSDDDLSSLDECPPQQTYSDSTKPWNEALLDSQESSPSLFRVLHTHDFSNREFVRPRGLYNTRNMCFFNSVLQVLVHTPSLYSLISDIIHRVPLEVNLTGGALPPPMRVLVSLAHFFYHYQNAGHSEVRRTEARRAISGEDFYNVICTQPRFNVERDRQEDAQEFMSDLLDSLETTFRDAPPTKDDVRDNVLDTKRHAREQRSEDDAWTEVGANNKKVETQLAGHQDLENPIDELFGGRFRSTLTKQGGKPSVTMEPFQQIMLDISEAGVNSVSSAVANLLQEEHLTLDSTSATKHTQFDQLPPVLIVHIKRFTFIMQNGDFEMGKITKPVTVDGKLQLSCVGKETLTYRAIGVIYHHGTSATRGHYTADVNVNNQWYKIDDEQVIPVDANEVVGFDSVNGGGSRSAYMVFYERCS